MRPNVVTVVLLILCCVGECEDQTLLNQPPVNVTVFTFRDGSKTDAVDVAEHDTGGMISYSVVSTDGRMKNFRESEMVSRTVKQLEFSALPKEMQAELAAGRAARKRVIYGAAQRVNNGQNRLQRAYNALSSMQEENGNTCDDVEERIREIDQRIALEEASYEGAKALLSGENTAAGLPANQPANPRIATTGAAMLQRLDKSAVSKVQLQQDRKIYAEALKKYKATLAKLQQEVDEAQAEVDAAKSQMAAAIAKPPVLYILSPSDVSASAPIPKSPDTIPTKIILIDDE